MRGLTLLFIAAAFCLSASQVGAQTLIGEQQTVVKIVLEPIEGNISQTLKNDLQRNMLDILASSERIALYLHEELVQQVSWERNSGALKCELPDDCRTMLMQKYGITQSLRLSFTPRSDGWLVMRLIMKSAESQREFSESLPEEAAAASLIENMLADILGYKQVIAAGQGALRLATFPINSQVFVGERLFGYTPMHLRSIAGTRLEVRFVHEGLPELKQTLIFPDACAESLAFDLEKKRGEVLIDSEPVGAAVLLDGKEVGVAPMVLRDVAAGEHRLKFHLPPFEDTEVVVEVPPEDLVRVKHMFQAEVGHLEVIPTSTKNVEIYLDGGKVAEGIYKADLPAGVYEIAVVRPGYVTHTRKLRIQPGEHLKIDPELESGLSLKPGEESEKRPDYRPGIFTGVASVLALGFGIFLELEAQDHYANATNYVEVSSNYKNEREEGYRTRVGGGVLMGLGAAGTLASIALFVWAPEKDVVVAPTTDGESVSLVTRFRF